MTWLSWALLNPAKVSGRQHFIWCLKKRRLETVRRLWKFNCSDSTGSIPDSTHTRLYPAFSGVESFFKNRLSMGILPDMVEPSDMHKTAVTTLLGLFNFTRTPFGLRNSSQTFQRFFHHVTRRLDFVFVYLDALLVTSPDHLTHKKHLKILFTRLAEYGIIIGPDKCQFGTTELSFLGHHVSAAGSSPLASAVDAIVNFVRPEKQRALRRYLGMINYYHRFIPNCANKLTPLNQCSWPPMKVIQDCRLSQISIWSGMKVQILRLSSLSKYLLMLHF